MSELQRRGTEHESRADEDDDRRSRSRASDHVDIVVDVKGKGRAVDNNIHDHITYISDRASDVDAAKVEGTRPVDRGRQASTEVISIRETTPPSRITSPASQPHDIRKEPYFGSHDEPKDRRKVRRNALQAIDAHLGHSSTERSAARSTGSGQVPLIECSTSDIRIEEISIRGAAKAATQAPSVPSISSTELSREPNGQISFHASHNASKGMPSRDIMARTRARLAKLRQEPTLSPTISSERGGHDVLSLDTPQAIVELDTPSVAGNQTARSGSSPSWNGITSDVPDNSAAQSSSTHSLSSHVESFATSALRAKLLAKLDNEKRASVEQVDLAGKDKAPSFPVGINSEVITTRLTSASDCNKVRGPNRRELSFRREAEMIENNLREQARLRVKLVAAKRTLADATADMTSGNVNLMTHEEHLRLQLKCDPSQ